MRSRCLCCKGERDPGKYMCLTCWRRLPALERRKLGRHDGLAGVRMIELAKQLGSGVPPEEVVVSA